MNIENTRFSNSILRDEIEILEDSENILRFRTYLAPNSGQNKLHFHSKIEEHFSIKKGSLVTYINGQKKVLKEGDQATISPFTNHRFFNTSQQTSIFEVTVLNPEKLKKGLQIMYGLANDGKTNIQGLPRNVLHAAIGLKMLNAFASNIPYLLQVAGITTLVFIGNFFGIEKKLSVKYCQ